VKYLAIALWACAFGLLAGAYLHEIDIIETTCGEAGGQVEDGTIYCKTPDGFEAVIW